MTENTLMLEILNKKFVELTEAVRNVPTRMFKVVFVRKVDFWVSSIYLMVCWFVCLDTIQRLNNFQINKGGKDKQDDD